MALGKLKVRVEADAIEYDRVPYRPCTLYPRGRLVPSDILEVDPTTFPPRVLLASGEFLPVDHAQAQALVDFAKRHSLPLVSRDEVWSWLLEPFLDTEPSPELVERQRAMLAGVGLDDAAVEAIRQRVSGPMSLLTYATWEWMHYGLFDVLDALGPFTLPGAFSAFYAEAMAIELRGGARPIRGEPREYGWS